ncbi:MAG TPA: SGNH family hydrolase [Beijerinckiaceae bacterium]|nr:SGNH family hydrolase [Beijerinckiaceae bacterium]
MDKKPILRLALAAACLVAAVVLILMASLSGARAQDEGNDQFWLQERARQRQLQQKQVQQRHQPQRPVIYQRPTHLIRRAKPVRGFTRAELPKNSSPTGPGAPATSAPTPTVDLPPAPAAPLLGQAERIVPKSKNAFRVAVIGDGLARMLGKGLTDAYADRDDVTILNRAHDDTGLVQEDYFNWIKASQDIASASPHIDMAVIMIGSDDRQAIRDSSGVYEPMAPKWKQIYASRAEAVAAIFHSRKIPLVWVGTPIMKDASLSDAMLDLNDIYRASAERDGASYLDVWDLFADERGHYELYGPDVNGETAKVRAADGVGFTRAGARKLAQVVENEIKRVMDGLKPQIDPAIAGIAPQVAPAEPLLPARLTSPSTRSRRGLDDLRALLPAPAAPIAPVIPIKPAAGPVVALTTPVVAPDGQLVTRSLVRSSSGGMKRVDEALKDGRPITARPGRADDFSWPQN